MRRRLSRVHRRASAFSTLTRPPLKDPTVALLSQQERVGVNCMWKRGCSVIHGTYISLS